MDIDQVVSRCPFLHNIATTQGRAFASSIACNPLIPASHNGRRPLLEETQDLAATFRLFHGPHGIVPLDSTSFFAPPCKQELSELPPVGRVVLSSADDHASCLSAPTRNEALKGRSPLALAPLAALSFGMPDFGDFIRKMQRGHEQPKKPSIRKQPQGNNKRPDISKPATASKTVQPPGPPHPPVVHQSSSAANGGLCPLRKLLGPSLSSVIFTSSGHLQCPAPIIQARAMLAATPPIQSLRPQALPVKFIAVGALSAALNVPCGMWREHTEKFSSQWFLAVHASIPFIAMLRKAVIMPKIAIACTIACAIAGQAIGARLEKERLAKVALCMETPPSLATDALIPLSVERAVSGDLASLQASARKARRTKRANDAAPVTSVTKAAVPTPRLCPIDGPPQWLTEVADKVEGFKLLCLPQAISVQ